MENLLSTLSQELQNKISDFKVYFIGLDQFNELNTRSEYDMDSSFYTAIENELKQKRF